MYEETPGILLSLIWDSPLFPRRVTDSGSGHLLSSHNERLGHLLVLKKKLACPQPLLPFPAAGALSPEPGYAEVGFLTCKPSTVFSLTPAPKGGRFEECCAFVT